MIKSQYINKVESLFSFSFEKEDLKVVEAIHQSFLSAPKDLKIMEQAKIILSIIVSKIASFDLSEFIEKNIEKESELKPFLIAILNGIYFGDFDLAKHSNESMEWFLVQILAETGKKKTIEKLLISLSLEKKLFLITHLFKHYREGSFILINVFEKIFKKGKLQDFLKHLQRKFFDVEKAHQYLSNATPITEEKFIEIFEKLEKEAVSQVEEIRKRIYDLIPLIIASPVTIIEEFEKKQKDSFTPQEKENALLKKERLENTFKPFLTHSFSMDIWTEFFKIFGLRGQVHLYYKEGQEIKEGSVLEMVRLMSQIFAQPEELIQCTPKEIFNAIGFIEYVIIAMETLFQNPQILQIGIDVLAFGMATRDKLLENEAGLKTVLNGFSALFNFIPQQDFPLFIFDQSEKKIFAKNRKFIEKLKAQIIHISKEETLTLAKRLNVQELIQAPFSKDFGFGGSRNAVFLLTPVLREAYKRGKKTFQEVLELTDAELKDLFQEFVLGGKASPCGGTIFMIDDDMEIPEANVFSHLIYATFQKNVYISEFGYFFGRGTKYENKLIPLETVLTHPKKIFQWTRWDPFPTSGSMTECVTKPRICLNTSLGNEEQHLRSPYESNFLLLPAVHLAKTRYPQKKWPTHYLVGLSDYLKKFIPYELGINLSLTLIDPAGSASRCILPWNDQGLPYFSNLREVFVYISQDTCKEELQKRFWKNVQDLIEPSKLYHMWIMQEVSALIQMNVLEIIKIFKKSVNLNTQEMNELKKIGKDYKFFKQDALYFFEFVWMLLKEQVGSKEDSLKIKTINALKKELENRDQIVFADYPLTYSFYQLTLSLGAGGFCEIIARLLSK